MGERRVALHIILILAAWGLCACGGGSGVEERPAPGTVPALPAVTTAYPAITRDAVWRMPGGDQFQSRCLDVTGPSDPQFKWEFAGDGDLLAAPRSGPDGRLYALTSHCLLALSPAGALVARYPLSAPVFGFGPHSTGHSGAQCCLPDGRWCYCDTGGVLHLLSLAGQELWSYAGDDPPGEVQCNGTLIVGLSPGGRLTALSLDGSELWRATATGIYTLGNDGLVVMANQDGDVSALRDGAMRWTKSEPGRYCCIPYIANNGNIYLASSTESSEAGFGGSRLEILSPAGVVLHSTEVLERLLRDSTAARQSVIEGPGGRVYFATAQGNVLGFDNAGRQVFRAALSAKGQLLLCAAADGALYVSIPQGTGMGENQLLRLDANGKTVWTQPGFASSNLALCPEPDGGVRGASDCACFSVNAAGALEWTCGLLGAGCSEPVFDAAGNCYAWCPGGLCALDAAGQLRWRCPAPAGFQAAELALSPANGLIYACGSQRLAAFSTAGELLWTKPAGNAAGELLTGADGTLYTMGAQGYSLQAFDPNGGLSWTYTDAAELCYRPAIDAAGNIYLISSTYEYYTMPCALASALPWSSGGIWQSGFLRCLGRNGALRFSAPLGAEPCQGPLAAPDGSVLVIGADGVLASFDALGRRRYAVQVASAGRYTLALCGADTVLVQRWGEMPDLSQAFSYSCQNLLGANIADGTQRWFKGCSKILGVYAVGDSAGCCYGAYEAGTLLAVTSITAQGQSSTTPGRSTALAEETINTRPPLLSPRGELILTCGGILQAYGD